MAKRYRFRLETLLRLRRQREDEQKRVVAQRLRQVGRIEQHKRLLESNIADQIRLTRDLQGGERIDVDQLKVGRYWMIRLRRGALEADAALAAQRAMLAQERSELAERRKATKVLERLEERQREAHRVGLEREERMELDDMNSTRFVHAMFEDCRVS